MNRINPNFFPFMLIAYSNQDTIFEISLLESTVQILPPNSDRNFRLEWNKNDISIFCSLISIPKTDITNRIMRVILGPS